MADDKKAPSHSTKAEPVKIPRAISEEEWTRRERRARIAALASLPVAAYGAFRLVKQASSDLLGWAAQQRTRRIGQRQEEKGAPSIHIIDLYKPKLIGLAGNEAMVKEPASAHEIMLFPPVLDHIITAIPSEPIKGCTLSLHAITLYSYRVQAKHEGDDLVLEFSTPDDPAPISSIKLLHQKSAPFIDTLQLIDPQGKPTYFYDFRKGGNLQALNGLLKKWGEMDHYAGSEINTPYQQGYDESITKEKEPHYRMKLLMEEILSKRYKATRPEPPRQTR